MFWRRRFSVWPAHVQKHSGMNQMGCSQAKKEIFIYVNFFLSYFSAQSVIVAQVTAQQHMCVCQSSPNSGVGKGGSWARWWVSPSGGHGADRTTGTWSSFFLSLKDTVVLRRAQMLVTASSCMKKCLQSLWLLKHVSCGMCNFQHLLQWERWEFSLRGMRVVLTL